MSPLACSLLALAALLASANAQSNCNSVLLGTATGKSVKFPPETFPPDGGEAYARDVCQEKGIGQAVGNLYTACNTDSNGAPPMIQAEYDGDITPAVITCPDLCPLGGALDILQYCA